MKLQRRSLNSEKERQLRNSQTEAESLLWHHLRNRQLAGHKFRRQHRTAFFILDFYCAEAALGIELDGKHHFVDEGKRNDEIRTHWLIEHGIGLLRFTNEEAMANPKMVLRRIAEEIGAPSEPPPPSPSPRAAGRGSE